MRRLGACALVLVAIPLVARCGGTSSETPWPIEPDNREPGPAGEARRHDDDEIDTRKLPDRYTKKDGGAPSDEDVDDSEEGSRGGGGEAGNEEQGAEPEEPE
jgi:hypothetical protein